MRRPPQIIFLVLVFLIHSSIANAIDHRELGPHEHGHGTLNLVIEGSKVNMELEVSGNDIVGFEHLPSNSEETEILQRAKKSLSEPLVLFEFPTSARCKIEDIKVNVEKDDEETDEQSHEHHSFHNEFHAEYSLTCGSIDNLKNINFEYFNLFQNSERLTVNIVSSKGQSKFEVSREQKSLDISSLL